MNPITKKNSLQILFNSRLKYGFYKASANGLKYVGVPFISQSASYKQYEHDCGYMLKKPSGGPIKGPVEIRYIFYRKNHVRCDLSNLVAAMDDIMVKYKIISDDNIKVIMSHDGTRCFVDPDNPRTEIYIYTYEGSDTDGNTGN